MPARAFVAGCWTIPIDGPVADLGAELRAAHRALSLPDALALAVIELLAADATWTFDERWLGVDPRVSLPSM